MRNKIRTYTGWPLQISFLIIAMLFNSVANAQRLNSDGLKMVNKLSVNNGNICFDAEFIYKGNKLSKFIFTYKEKHYNLDRTSYIDVYKDILERNENSIIQKSYMNGKPYNRYKYDYKFGEDSKLIHFDVLLMCLNILNYKRYIGHQMTSYILMIQYWKYRNILHG